MSYTVVIPARYQSTRLPGKPLKLIGDKPMVQWVYEQAIKSGADDVIVATDDERIKRAVEQFGGQVCMTSSSHESGTERLAEVIQKMGIAEDHIVVNVQGDEPLIPPQNIRQVANNLASFNAPMATLAVEIDDKEEVFNPNAVKVVTDKNGYAIYFSRASIPWDKNHFSTTQEVTSPLKRHIGIYAYRAGFIEKYIHMPASPVEKIESLEQLRVLWHGEKIHVDIAEVTPPVGVDTPEDLEAIRMLVAKK